MSNMKEKIDKLASKNKVDKIIKLAGDKDKEVALDAIAALGHTTGEDGKNFLVVELGHADADYRTAAATALGETGDGHYKAVVLQALQKETDEAVKTIMKETISKFKDY